MKSKNLRNMYLSDPEAENTQVIVLIFFFSSRRRHTRLTCDWSSDVCSSDLHLREKGSDFALGDILVKAGLILNPQRLIAAAAADVATVEVVARPRLSILCCGDRSEEHTSELQSHVNLVCRLLLEKKKKI